jgi:hypothetical protein
VIVWVAFLAAPLASKIAFAERRAMLARQVADRYLVVYHGGRDAIGD